MEQLVVKVVRSKKAERLEILFARDDSLGGRWRLWKNKYINKKTLTRYSIRQPSLELRSTTNGSIHQFPTFHKPPENEHMG